MKRAKKKTNAATFVDHFQAGVKFKCLRSNLPVKPQPMITEPVPSDVEGLEIVSFYWKQNTHTRSRNRPRAVIGLSDGSKLSFSCVNHNDGHRSVQIFRDSTGCFRKANRK